MAAFGAQDPNGTSVQQLEMLLRIAVFKPANQLLGFLLQQAADRIDAQYQVRLGEVFKGRISIRIQGIFGEVVLSRDYYYHPGKKQGHYPADASLGLQEGYTPALARLICLEGADESSYQKAENHLLETGGIAIGARQIQRVLQRIGDKAELWQNREINPQACVSEAIERFYVSADATGIPMRPEELEGRKGKQEDGSAKTRQVYLGCVFTQHGVDEDGHPVRDWQSTTYVSSMAGIDEFGPILRREAYRRGMGKAKEVILLIDGALGLENMGYFCFPGCIQIVDFYHAIEHGGRVLEVLLGKDHPEYEPRRRRWAKRLLANGVEKLIEETRQEAAKRGRLEQVEKELRYFVNNAARMQYRTYRRKGLFIGSGVIEAGCKTVIGARCKQSGMFWSQPGAEHILSLRCIHASHRTDLFWKDWLNELAAQNDVLPLAA